MSTRLFVLRLPRVESFRRIGFLMGAFLVAPLALPAADIVALCIGNDAYNNPEDRLDTPVADATLMSETLRGIDGVSENDVVMVKNATREEMSRALRLFREKARGAKLAVVFYSGHGMEDRPTGYDRAETFLLPVDAEIRNSDHLPDRAVGLGDIMKTFEGLPPGGRVVILDCCRTGAPSATKALAGLGKSFTGTLDDRVARALGEAELAEGTLVSFAAGPGRVAAAFLNDTDAYSPFTHFLAKGIREEGGDLFTLISRATATTRQATRDRQVPRMRFDGDPSLIMAVRIPGGGFMPPVPPDPDPPGGGMRTVADRLRGATKEEPFENTLGMKFVPVETNGARKLLFSVWETRISDFNQFASKEDREEVQGTWTSAEIISAKEPSEDFDFRLFRSSGFGNFWAVAVPGYGPDSSHPVVNVSWRDANRFCEWLSEKEGIQYRLPTSAEWTSAAAIPTDMVLQDGISILSSRSSIFPWGRELESWRAVDNFGGKELSEVFGIPTGIERREADAASPGSTRWFKEYSDRTPFLAPVGRFHRNGNALFDIGGNASEWCADRFGEDGLRVVRGGSWKSWLARDFQLNGVRRELETSFESDIGFRVVLDLE